MNLVKLDVDQGRDTQTTVYFVILCLHLMYFKIHQLHKILYAQSWM